MHFVFLSFSFLFKYLQLSLHLPCDQHASIIHPPCSSSTSACFLRDLVLLLPPLSRSVLRDSRCVWVSVCRSTAIVDTVKTWEVHTSHVKGSAELMLQVSGLLSIQLLLNRVMLQICMCNVQYLSIRNIGLIPSFGQRTYDLS